MGGFVPEWGFYSRNLSLTHARVRDAYMHACTVSDQASAPHFGKQKKPLTPPS
eukprot:m.92761 g.92761  ORF g.92761 m.92761 type:complete len:53 (+) comp26567_c0_seq2:204-362(+)